MFDVRLFRRPAFTALMCLPFSVTFGLAAWSVFLPVFLQSGGASPSRAAVELTPLETPVLLVPLAARWLTSRWSMRTLLVAGPVLIAAGSFGLVVVDRGTSPWVSAEPHLLFGIGVGVAFSVMDNAAVSTVPVDKAGSAAGMFNTMRKPGGRCAHPTTPKPTKCARERDDRQLQETAHGKRPPARDTWFRHRPPAIGGFNRSARFSPTGPAPMMIMSNGTHAHVGVRVQLGHDHFAVL